MGIHKVFLLSGWQIFCIGMFLFLTSSALAIDVEDFTFDFGVQVRTHYRHSVDNRFALGFPAGAAVRNRGSR